MTVNRIARWLVLGLAAGAAWIGLSAPAQAIPVFARQTGHNCQACHISYPELTAYGREFKLNGYTFGEAQTLPLAAAIMGEYDTLSNGKDATTGAPTCTGSTTGSSATTNANCGHAELVQYSIFYGGRISDNFGMFGQMSGNQFPISNAGTFSPTADNTEFRYVHRILSADSLEPEAVIGLNMNNNPTMQDVWNAVPAWRFPWFPYLGAGYGPSAAPYIDNPSGGHNKVGIGAYAWIHKTWYAELNLYHSATGPLSFMNWGNGGTEVGMGNDVLKGENPYFRLAYSRDWDYSSLEVGVFGFDAHTYECNPADSNDYNANPAVPCVGSLTATNHYKDIAVDAQYQYNKGEPWIFSAAGSYIHETNDLTALYQALGSVAMPNHTINEFQIKGTAYYNRQYGVTLGYSAISGTTDPMQYAPGSGGSATGNPGSNWWTLELNYLPVQDMRFSLLYQNFTKINGGSTNFDGAGNNASGQNRLTAAIWWIW